VQRDLAEGNLEEGTSHWLSAQLVRLVGAKILSLFHCF